jgi:isopentenyldiphosphate isomerase
MSTSGEPRKSYWRARKLHTNVAMGEQVVIGSDGRFASAAREQVHRDGTWHWCVHLLATNGSLIYLQRRAADLARNPDRWESTAAGHINVEDARDQQSISADKHAAQVALMHEVSEELGVTWDIDRAEFLGEVDATGAGGGEICNCYSFVFRLDVGAVNFSPTPEVAEVKAFEIEEVAQALRNERGLPAADGRERRFANNFAPIFGRFTSPK